MRKQWITFPAERGLRTFAVTARVFALIHRISSFWMEERSKKTCRYFETLRSKGEEAGSLKSLKLDCLTLFIVNGSVVYSSDVTKKRNPCMFTELCDVGLSDP